MLGQQNSLTIIQGIKGYGKTNYVKQRVSTVSPLFIVDIRNEYSHIEPFRSLDKFVYFLIGDKPSFFQKRLAFQTKGEWVKGYELLACLQNCTLVIDEADAIFTVRDFERPIMNVILGSRNNNVNLLLLGKRPFLIPIFVRSQADEFVIFHLEEKRDIEYLDGRLRVSMPKDPFKLSQGEAIIYRQGETPKLQKFDKFDPNKKHEVELSI